MKPEVELVTTGAELLNGSVVNRHAQWLGLQLFQAGWSLTRDTTVADSLDSIRDAISAAASRTPVVIVTGGLGPTSDDLTRDAAAAWYGASVVMHEPSRLAIVESYRKRDKPLNDTVERHALVVDGGEVLENRHGLAAGMRLEKNGRQVFLLPGPPREFQGMMNDHVLPRLKQMNAGRQTRRHVFMTAGLGESDIAAKLERAKFSGLNVETAYCAEPGRVSIRVREREDAEAFDQAVRVVEESLGDAIYSHADESIEQVVGRLLKERNLTLAVAESCTGGLIGRKLTSVSGSSAYFLGGVIAYHDDLKKRLLNVDADVLNRHGAVSDKTAAAMAEGVRAAAGSHLGLSVTGIAGPGGGTVEKPVGLVYISVGGDRGVEVRELRLGGDRETIRESSATLALNLVRLYLEPRR